MTEQELIDQGYKDGKKSFEYLAKIVLRRFNLAKVANVMCLTKCYWWLGEEGQPPQRVIPDRKDLLKIAVKLLREAYEGEKWISRGGFTACYKEGVLSLEFTLEHQNSEE